VKAFNGHHQPKKAINKAKGEKKTEIKNTPPKRHHFIATAENKEGVACAESIV
jgi:hypothetical protein